MERILLNALLASERARLEMLPALLPELTNAFVTREIFEGLRQVAGPGGEFSYPALEGRLNAPGKELLRDVVTADESGEEAVSWEQAQNCLRRLESDFQKRQMSELRAQVKSAEREGRVSEALSLMAELSRLERENRGTSGG
jgi:uncharacterized protein with von Willebrand factor type A (vWA) domain